MGGFTAGRPFDGIDSEGVTSLGFIRAGSLRRAGLRADGHSTALAAEAELLGRALQHVGLRSMARFSTTIVFFGLGVLKNNALMLSGCEVVIW